VSTPESTGSRRGPVEHALRHDRLIVFAATALIVAAAGIYTVLGGGMAMSALQMTRMAGAMDQPMSMAVTWTATYAALIFLMWWIMMIAMMTPSAAPVLLLYTAIKRQGPDGPRATALSGLFLTGYLIAWAGFSAVATSLQWGLESVGLSDGAMMTVRSRGFAGALLLGAGIYQFSSLKNACLDHCRSPGQFLSLHNRPGAAGALRMGMHHGVFCLGCCWALMILLFAGGIMNLWWIAGLAVYVLVEKTAPRGDLVARAAGAGLVLAGGYMLATAIW